MHDTNWGTPLTREEQFNLDWANHARWAIGPVGTREQYRKEWEQLHDGCADCAR